MFDGIFQPMHLLIILFIVLLLFGPGKLPELGAGLGKGIKEFKKALSQDKYIEAEKVKEGEGESGKKA